MRRLWRLVIDTNVFISVFLLHGRSSALVPLLLSRKTVLLVNGEILKEYFEVAIRPKFGHTPGRIRELFGALRPHVLVVKPVAKTTVHLRDPKDLRFIDCAIAGDADFIVSGDKDLLVIRRVGEIPVISMAELIERIR